ncbi:hypothetical protein ACJX0J_019579, partial [Zea mays]
MAYFPTSINNLRCRLFHAHDTTTLCVRLEQYRLFVSLSDFLKYYIFNKICLCFLCIIYHNFNITLSGARGICQPQGQFCHFMLNCTFASIKLHLTLFYLHILHFCLGFDDTMGRVLRCDFYYMHLLLSLRKVPTVLFLAVIAALAQQIQIKDLPCISLPVLCSVSL